MGYSEVMRRVAIAIDLDWPVRHHHGIAAGALKYGREKGWACEIEPFLGFPGAGAGRYDGALGRVTRELAAWAVRTKTPVVNVWVNSPDRKHPRVNVDLAAAGGLAARHLLDRGFRTFGVLSREGDSAADRLVAGFRAAVGDRGFRADVLPVPMPDDVSDWLRLQKPLSRWIKSFTPPLGVFATEDILGRHLCDACLRAGLRIPDDVAIVGSGNTSLLCDLLEPTLSSVEHGFERVGRRAAEVLEALMSGRKAPRGPIELPPAGVVSRRSSDQFAVEDPTVASAMRAIWARSAKPMTVASLLAEIPSSRRTLERRFREVLGRTIHDEIRRAHLERSKRLLVETREPLKAVAVQAGFRDPQQFSRVFRAAESVTPQEYRRLHAES